MTLKSKNHCAGAVSLLLAAAIIILSVIGLNSSDKFIQVTNAKIVTLSAVAFVIAFKVFINTRLAIMYSNSHKERRQG